MSQFKPSRPEGLTPRGLYAREQRRDQAKFHRLVVARDEGKCTKCGRTVNQLTGVYPDLKMLIADHINPLGIGGTNDVSNGQTHCFFCDVILGFGWRSRYKKGSSEEEERAIRARHYAQERI